MKLTPPLIASVHTITPEEKPMLAKILNSLSQTLMPNGSTFTQDILMKTKDLTTLSIPLILTKPPPTHN
jgi:hypothetical protein